MNGATALSANITNKPMINKTKISGASHHFFVCTMNWNISFKKAISFANHIVINKETIQPTVFKCADSI